MNKMLYIYIYICVYIKHFVLIYYNNTRIIIIIIIIIIGYTLLSHMVKK